MPVVKPMYIYPMPYVFQEIRNVKTESVFGYEALLRPEDGTSPRDYVNARMMMGGTHQLEIDTFFNAVKSFSELRLPGRLVINSFPNECLDVHESRALADEYGKDIMARIVIEILEYPFVSQTAWFEKERFMLRYDMLSCLNAFGDGIFNDYTSVMFYHPDIVSIPSHIIHDFADDPQRTEYIKMMISNLKENGATVLAQGVETVVEYQLLKDMGIDLAQGYYIGMPGLPDAPEFIPDGDTRKFTD